MKDIFKSCALGSVAGASILAVAALMASSSVMAQSSIQAIGGMSGNVISTATVTASGSMGGTGSLDLTFSTDTGATTGPLTVTGVATAPDPIGDPATDDAFLNWAASVEYVENRLASAGGGGGGVAPDEDGNILIENADATAGTASNVDITTDSFSATVTNAEGNTHGLTVGTSSTVLSGGTASTTITLSDSGADFGGARITGIAPGVAPDDAVNLSQMQNYASSAAAIVSAMDVVLPQEGNNLSMRLGAGYHGPASAYGITLVGRVRENVFVDVAYGLSTEKNSGSQNGGKAGITLQW